MPVLDSYLFFAGNCAEAMRFYEKTLGATLEAVMTYAQAPPSAQTPECKPGEEDRVMHASLLVGDRRLMASDTPSDHPQPTMSGFSLSLGYPTTAQATQVFDALAAGGKVTMPLGKTFWAEAFGMVTDRFGTPWMVSAAAAQ
jgi:PhnB protein